MLPWFARLNVFDVLRTDLEVVDVEVCAEVVNLVRRILHVLNDDEG